MAIPKGKKIIIVKSRNGLCDTESGKFMVYRAEQPEIKSFGKTREEATGKFFKEHMLINIIDLTDDESL